VTVVRVGARALQDDETTDDLFRQVCSLADAVGRHNLVLNLGAVEFMATRALGKLALLNRNAQAAQGRLALCQLTRAAAGARRRPSSALDDRFVNSPPVSGQAYRGMA
jgi:hypothetical protein